MAPAPFADYLSPIRYDFACRRCFYSLKGLPFDGVCPECGQSILHSAAHVAQELETTDWSRFRSADDFKPAVFHAAAVRVAAGVAEVDPDMLDFVIDTSVFIDLALRPPGIDERRDTPRDASSATYAQALLHFASVYFGDRASATLRTWGLDHSRGLGDALSILVRAGIMQREPGDSLDDFGSLYHLRH
ncbi:MAG: hypothetical protein AAGJ38_02685 [Planctomycetota bacterium]